MASAVLLAATIHGTGDDVLTGTESSDVIIPFDGNDTVYANGGAFWRQRTTIICCGLE
jgi:Ca2+-binding RTX toxin-like protein